MNLKTTIKTTIICALLLNILVLSAPQLISGNIASASTASANFLPNCYIPWPLGPDTENETTLSLAVFQYVTSVLDNCYYCENCTVSTYCSVLSILKNDYDNAIVFSKGHRSAPYPGTSHMSLLDNNENHLIDCDHIYPRTSSGNTVTFLWHCETARFFPNGTAPQDGYGYYGMPYCWTHNQYLGYYYYGGSGTQVFLGWNNNVPPLPYPEQGGGSPQYEYAINANYNYANVAGTFWSYMSNGTTIMQALNNLSYIIYGTAFGGTPLNNWLIVLGNKYLELP
jgi:hypothetical protein